MHSFSSNSLLVPFRPFPQTDYNAAMRLLILLLMAGTVGAAEVAIHNVTGYTPTAKGIREFPS